VIISSIAYLALDWVRVVGENMKMEGIRIGALGAGGFGLFALQHFTQIPGVTLAGMAATHREAAFAMSQRFGIPEPVDEDTLLARDDINLVYISTPPFLHHPQAMKALKAGKHVICEKPLALNLAQADEMISLARDNHLLLIANLMQRYNPLYELVRRLCEAKILGEFLHGYFENYASDEALGSEHWFWDRTKSGGIFIEHGVHFFDLYAGWLGPGRVVSAQRVLRPGSGLEEQVQCAVRYHDGTIVNFYHGFTQAARMDRQEFRLLFERGDLTLDEWVPVRARIRAGVDEKATRDLMDLFPNARLDMHGIYGGAGRNAKGRHKPIDIYQQIVVDYGLEGEKMVRYGELMRAMMRDQIHWIHDRSHKRIISEVNGHDSLAMAVEATSLADASR
jgi:predicted dehydrogenase